MSFIVNGVETIKNDTNKNISTEVYSYNPKTKRSLKEHSLVMGLNKKA
ncbi:hypothetical protein H477_3491 [[Clostridium] sordellii ATCC 9714]|nr:hypothetical protein H477_3491 [[Clostridium] sordellii ATCC 9714] [Paeniclostridium sordellii ATCC 9714]